MSFYYFFIFCIEFRECYDIYTYFFGGWFSAFCFLGSARIAASKNRAPVVFWGGLRLSFGLELGLAFRVESGREDF